MVVLKKRIISDKVEIGPPRLTRYEYAAIVAMLAVQIAYGAPVLLSEKELETIDTKLLTHSRIATRQLISIKSIIRQSRICL